MADKQREYTLSFTNIELQTLVAAVNVCRELVKKHAPELTAKLEHTLDSRAIHHPHCALDGSDCCEGCGLDIDYWAQLPICPDY